MHTLNLADGPIVFGQDGTITQTPVQQRNLPGGTRTKQPRKPNISID